MTRRPAIRLTYQDRVRLRKLITDYSGLDKSIQTDSALDQALAQRLVVLRLDDLADYWPLLRQGSASDGELNSLIRLLTNKETFFFREPHHFAVLRDRVLRELLATGRRPLRLWSAGCATGEEPYSLAITLLDYQIRHGEFEVQLMATDIDGAALEKARMGYYGERAVRQVPDGLRQRYFTFDGQTYRVSPEVAQMVTFEVHNLAEDCCPPGLTDLDVIFCRNVTIYFDDVARDRLNARLADSLRVGGYLFVASAETMGHNRGRLELVSFGNTFLFHKAPPPKEPERPSLLARLRRQQEQAVTEALPAVPTQATARPPQPRLVPAPEAEAPTPPAPAEPVSLLERARQAFQQQDYEAALRELDRLPADQPVWIEAYRLRGAILLQQERLDEAEAACQIVLAHDPWHADAHFLLGLIFRQQGQIDNAIGSLRQAIYLQPSHRHAHYYLAEIFRALGLEDKARREYENTLNILAHLPEPEPTLNLTGLEDDILRQACEVNLRKLLSAKEANGRNRA